MKERYSKIYKVVTGKHTFRSFRYDYEECILECVYVDIEDGIVLLDSIGLNPENWKDNPKYWCERYNEDITEELRYMI